MIRATGSVRLETPVETVWKWVSNLEWLVTANMFHHKALFLGPQRQGAGTRIVVYHRIFAGPVWARYVRITHWEEPVRIGWVETDSINVRHMFPHSQQFRLERLGETATRLTDEVRGSLNLPLIEHFADRAAQSLLVERAVRRELAYFKSRIK